MSIKETERKILEMIRSANVVVIYRDVGHIFSHIKGLSETPASIDLKYGIGPDGKRWVRYATIKMGVSERDFNAAVKRTAESGVNQNVGGS
jgi:hypothetical protein